METNKQNQQIPKAEMPQEKNSKNFGKSPEKNSLPPAVIIVLISVLIAALIAVILLVTGIFRNKKDSSSPSVKTESAVSPVSAISSDSTALPEEMNTDNLSYSVGLELIDRMKERLNNEDFRKYAENTADLDDMIDACSLPEKPSVIYKINFAATDQYKEAWPEELKELGISDYDETAYMNDETANAASGSVIANCGEEYISAYSQFNSIYGMGVNYICDGPTDTYCLLFVQDDCDPVLVTYVPYENGTVRAGAKIIIGAVGESISENPDSIAASLDEDELEAEITLLENPETCEIPSDTQSESQEIADAASQCVEKVTENGLANLMLYSEILSLDMTAQQDVIDAFKDGNVKIQDVSCIRASDISENIKAVYSEAGVDISSLSEDVRTLAENSMIGSLYSIIPQITDSENAVWDSAFSSYTVSDTLFKGELLLEDGTVADETVLCIVDCGENLSPICLIITPDEETGVTSVSCLIAFGTTTDDFYQDALHIDEICKKLAENNADDSVTEQTDETETEEPTEPAPAKADRVEFTDGFSGSNEIGTITAYSGSEVIWQKSTNAYPGAQLSQVGDIGIHNDMYYYYEGGSVYALNLTDGGVIWQNTDLHGGSVTYVFDENGNLILTGSLTMMLMEIDMNGNTLFLVNPGSDQYMWPSITGLEGNKVRMTVTTKNSSMQEISILVDLSDFSITEG